MNLTRKRNCESGRLGLREEEQQQQQTQMSLRHSEEVREPVEVGKECSKMGVWRTYQAQDLPPLHMEEKQRGSAMRLAGLGCPCYKAAMTLSQHPPKLRWQNGREDKQYSIFIMRLAAGSCHCILRCDLTHGIYKSYHLILWSNNKDINPYT